MIRKTLFLAFLLSLSIAQLPAHAANRYTPHQGDYFQYHETIDVNNGQGYNYTGYSDHTDVFGIERMNNVFVNGTVASNYSYTWNFRDYSGLTQSGKSAGNFTWSSTTFYYVKGTDNQTGYVSPIGVWYFADNSTQQNGTIYLLNTVMTVTSTSYSYYLTSESRYVSTIRATGSSSYQRNDSYGKFNAAYTWTTYFDPSTGYIVGYDYTEQDTSSSGNGFTYTEALYVNSTSYPLTTAAPPNTGISPYLGLIVGLAVFIAFIIIIVLVVYAVSRSRRRLPRHVYPQVPVAPPTVDLTPKQQPPVQQIVVKEIVKVKCRYCGALIDSTVQACPFCGAPRT
jgi:hypothetical protein